MRIDGYRWDSRVQAGLLRTTVCRLSNAGTHKISNAIVLGRCVSGWASADTTLTHHTGRWRRAVHSSGRRTAGTAHSSTSRTTRNSTRGSGTPRTGTGQQCVCRRREFWFEGGNIVAFHYLGDHRLAKQVSRELQTRHKGKNQVS